MLTACGNSATQSAKGTGGEGNSAEDTVVLKLSHGFPTSSFVHTFMEWFDEEIRAKSDGRLALEIYPNAQLVPPDQEMTAILQGQIDMSHASSPVMAGFDPIWNVYELPFVFDYDPENPEVFLDNRMAFNNSENGGGVIKQKMEENGLKVLSLGFVDTFGSIYTTDAKNAVTGPDSVQGLKLRSPGGLIGPETLDALGASSVTIAGAEVITALQQKLVDGLLTTPIYAHDMSLPVESISAVPLFNTITPLIISLEKFESLPEDLQQILEETGKELEEYAKEQVLEKSLEVFQNLEEKGIDVYYPTDEEIEEWIEATAPARELFKESVEEGEELLEELASINE